MHREEREGVDDCVELHGRSDDVAGLKLLWGILSRSGADLQKFMRRLLKKEGERTYRGCSDEGNESSFEEHCCDAEDGLLGC
jgi:hypothetical protein